MTEESCSPPTQTLSPRSLTTKTTRSIILTQQVPQHPQTSTHTWRNFHGEKAVPEAGARPRLHPAGRAHQLSLTHSASQNEEHADDSLSLQVGFAALSSASHPNYLPDRQPVVGTQSPLRSLPRAGLGVLHCMHRSAGLR